MMSELADSQLPGPSQAVVETDWSKCILCHKITSEILRCSADHMLVVVRDTPLLHRVSCGLVSWMNYLCQ